MKLEAVKNAVTSKVGRQILLGKKHTPTLLFAGGVVGVVGATVMACKATLKLDSVLEEAEKTSAEVANFNDDRYSEEDRVKDLYKVKVRTAMRVVKLYAPAVAVGTVSVAALTGSHVVLSKRNTALMAAYSALDKGFSQYRDRVREEYGDEKDLEFRRGVDISQETVEGKNGSKVVERKNLGTGLSIYARCFDETNPNWNPHPDYNRAFLHAQQTYLNDMLHARGHVFLNEVYDALGMERSKPGAVVGWVMGNGDNFVDIGMFNPDSERARAFINGQERSIFLDFNVDGVIYDLI